MKITLKHVSYVSPNLKPSFIYQEQSGFFLLHAINNGVGSKIGVVRPGTREVDVAVLCAKAVRPDGYLSVDHFACTTVHNGGGRHLRMGGVKCLYACKAHTC